MFVKKNILKNSKTIFVIDFNSIESHSNWLIENRVNKIDLRKYPSKFITIDFSKCRFLKPYHIAPLACLIHEYQSKGYNIKIGEIPDKIKTYLSTFYFEQFCNNSYDNNFPEPLDYKTLPLWKINQTGINIYPIKAQEYFEKNHFDGMSLFALSLLLAELMNNVFDHSKSKIPGFTFTQYNSTKKQIITCVCDFGIGIPKQVNQYLKETGNPRLDNISALIKSFELNFSTKSKPHNRGFGWDNIFSNVTFLKSKMLIISNNALYWLLENNEVKTALLKNYFPGTCVIIYLNTDYLPEKEEEIADELTIF